MAGLTCEVRLTVRWWVRWYLAGVALTAQVTGLRPDMGKVAWWVCRGLRVEPVYRPLKRSRVADRAGHRPPGNRRA